MCGLRERGDCTLRCRLYDVMGRAGEKGGLLLCACVGVILDSALGGGGFQHVEKVG